MSPWLAGAWQFQQATDEMRRHPSGLPGNCHSLAVQVGDTRVHKLLPSAFASSPGILNHICVCFRASLLAVCFVVKVSQGSQNLGGLAFCAKIWEAFPSQGQTRLGISEHLTHDGTLWACCLGQGHPKDLANDEHTINNNQQTKAVFEEVTRQTLPRTACPGHAVFGKVRSSSLRTTNIHTKTQSQHFYAVGMGT